MARDFICFGNADAVIVVTDATCLERNLNLVYQMMELTDKVILCINLIDEAKKKKINIDVTGLKEELGIPIVTCAARSGVGIDYLKSTIYKLVTGKIKANPNLVYYDNELEEIVTSIEPITEKISGTITPRWLALRMIDGDERLIHSLYDFIADEETLQIQSILDNANIENKQDIRDTISTKIYNKAYEITKNHRQ